MKAFYRQRIPEPSCAKKGTVDIDILVTSRNGALVNGELWKKFLTIV